MKAMERITVTLPTVLVERIDGLGLSRSRFIAEAIEHDLSRRRLDGLRVSVQSPHPETAAFVDTEVGGWMSDLPDSEALVDVSAGTPVRWIAGQGWTTE